MLLVSGLPDFGEGGAGPMSWSVEDVQQRVAATPERELLARRAGLENTVRRRGAGGYTCGHSDGADFELVAIHHELMSRHARRTR